MSILLLTSIFSCGERPWTLEWQSGYFAQFTSSTILPLTKTRSWYRTTNHSEVTMAIFGFLYKKIMHMNQAKHVYFFFSSENCIALSLVFPKSAFLSRQSLFCKSSKRFACTFVPSPCLYNYDQFDSVCIPSIKMLSFTQHLLC